MENRFAFHGFWFLVGLLSCFVMGSAVPVLAVVAGSALLEYTLQRFRRW